MSDQSETIGALAAALAKAQGAMAGAKKDNVNPHFKSKYADLASIWDAIRAPLSANGLAVIQLTEPCETGASVTTALMHTSGEWVKGTLFVPASKQDAQGFGSAMTYARRYSLAAITGIAPEDDDGQAAVRSPVKAAPTPRAAMDAAAAMEGLLAEISAAATVSELMGIYGGIVGAGLPQAEQDTLKKACTARRKVIEKQVAA